jgi:hypothetical protein
MAYRSRPMPADTSLEFSSRKLRVLSLVALIGYPVGAVLEFYADSLIEPIRAFGALLRFCSIGAMFLVAGSSLADLVTPRKRKKLDEFELRIRHAALAKAYAALSVLVGVLAIYTYVAFDFELPLPRSPDAWQALCFYVLLLILVLPTASLVWSPDAALVEADEAGE